ncbi:prepilin-type N-terminal cleavage/methylation domain-containing protein [candidate division WWE3 bacterium]|nr:prepilin-type N-terminal cleavage/methylation domain-containing protein [candidate division WWE3 bacterium]
MPKDFESGFTLLELLIVITVVSILAGILLQIVNPTLMRNRARDGVRAGNVAKISQTVEAYNAAEGSYPVDQTALNTYIQNWPTETGITYDYALTVENTKKVACVSVVMATSANFFKYLSNYISPETAGGDASFAGKVLKDCANGCAAAAALANDYTGCVKIN